MKIAILILWGSIIWLPILQYYMLKNETKFKKNIVLGVTLPNEAREDANVLAITESFIKNSRLVCIAAMALAAVLYLASNQSNFMTLWGIWLLVRIILPVLPYIRANIALHDYKDSMGWTKERGQVFISLSSIPSGKWLNPIWFAIPTALCFIPMLFDRSYLRFCFVCAIVSASCRLGYRYLYRNKSEMVDENISLTSALSYIRKRNWGRLWLLMAYLGPVVGIGMLIAYKNALAGGLFLFAVSMGFVAVAIKMEMTTRSVQERLTKDSGSEWYVDDDDKWIFGMLYNNPEDSRLIINSRIGLNSTINLARPAGKILMVLTLFLLLYLPFMGSSFDSLGRRKIDISLSEGTLVAKSGMTSYEIDAGQIDSVILLEDLPDGLYRVMGTGMPTLIKGDFTATGLGHINVMADPTTPPFILIHTTSGKYYLLGSRDSSATEDYYGELEKLS